MHWKKLGLVYGPDRTLPWAFSHAMIPTPVRIDRYTVRVFVTCCDAAGIGRPSYVDVSAADLTKVLFVSKTPILDVGRPGTFDENGVLACSVIKNDDGDLLMYYVGFELGAKIRYRLLTGIAKSVDNGKSFTRQEETPVLDRSSKELYFRAGPCCIKNEDYYKMWYVAGSCWLDLKGKQMPVYDIRYIESTDGFNWPNEGITQIPITKKDEHGFGRPYVIKKLSGGYRMFYSVRRISHGAYRLGYAESLDGKVWQRMDEQLNLDVSKSGFDSEAIMYAAPITIGKKLYVFYNGNNFGEDGFAVAELIKE